MSKAFAKLGVSTSLLKSLTDLNISEPTEIQEKSIPILLSETDDFVGLAKTGTGKTLAFGVPLLQLVDVKIKFVQAVVLVPTRELGHQIFSNFERFASHLPDISIAVTCGGIPIKPQIERLKETTHILIATPGRLLDLISRKAIDISKVNFLVLDEADEMLTALKTDLDTILISLPKKKRIFLFSATLSGKIKQLVQNYLSKQVTQVSVSMKVLGNQSIQHEYVVVEPIEKLDVLMHFLATKDGERGIIFCKTKAAVNKLAKNLAINRFSSGALHGSLSQAIRNRIMDQFRAGHINILIATDLAARGIDVKETSYIVNYHLPDVYDTYVHRSGRSARVGANGYSLTVLQQEEAHEIADFEQELGIQFKAYNKPTPRSIEDNNTFLWAKQLFKTKPNRDVDQSVKDRVKTIFHHLTKDELIEKMLANYLKHQKHQKQ